jgi:hypothetical protein
MPEHRTQFELEVLPQPDDSTCGPTALHAVYRYWGLDLPLERVIDEVAPLPQGGTLAVSLACHALRQGFDATIYTYNLQVFDPTWFEAGVDIAGKLRQQVRRNPVSRLRHATDAYLEFLSLGGAIRYEDLTSRLVRSILRREIPILTGLSATYLYDDVRERDEQDDDIGGQPVGHFVVLCGYDPTGREVMVADSLRDNRYASHYYRVGMEKLLAAILLGIVTYDANLLVLTPREEDP